MPIAHTELSLRIAGLEDLERIVATYNATVPSRLVTADLQPVTVDSRRPWFDAHDPTRRPLWLVLLLGRYQGWLSFQSFYGRPAYDGVAEVSLYLERSAQGRGLGKKVLAQALAMAPALHLHTLLGFIFGHNEPSLQLFFLLDFVKWGHLPEVANMDGLTRALLILGRKV